MGLVGMVEWMKVLLVVLRRRRMGRMGGSVYAWAEMSSRHLNGLDLTTVKREKGVFGQELHTGPFLRTL